MTLDSLGAKPSADPFAALAHELEYLRPEDLSRIHAAYRFAYEAHLGQFRASGVPYITHPLAVAGLCAQWKLDAEAVMAALLHDAIEDCGVSKIELADHFGDSIADLVDGLTKMNRLHFKTREETQAESFRKMLLAMARDVRVMLIKLFDRLHNMRTLDAMAPEKRSLIAYETLAIYEPIAHRLGLDNIYREFQDLSFRHAHPWRCAAIEKAMHRARGSRRDMISRTGLDVANALKTLPFGAEISWRAKTAYSIYRKMREQRRSFASMYDILGFRIVVETSDECYRVLGVLHATYKPLPGGFEDYIAVPKQNGYQSLHTTLFHPLGTAAEFQIRTAQMHEVAETGVAAHWLYKSSGFDAQLARSAQRLEVSWLRSLMERRDDAGDHNEFLEHVRIDMLGDSVYVFTPKSRVLALPRGSTTVDFAYAIHTEVGDRCVAAKINGEPTPLRTVLKNGDVVEIVGAPSARPYPAWLSFVRTTRASTRIRRFLRDIEAPEAQEAGETMFARALRVEGLQMPLEVQADSPIYKRLISWSANSSLEELFADIGKGRKNANIVAKRFARLVAKWGDKEVAYRFAAESAGATDLPPSSAVVLVDGSEGTSMTLARCCRPIPGDAIVSYLGRGEGATVHSVDCVVGRRLRERGPDRWLSASWAELPTRSFETEVLLLVRRGKGLLAQVAQCISDAAADITHMKMTEAQGPQTAELLLLIAVRDRVHLAEIMRRLRRAPIILRVARVRGDAPASVDRVG